MSALPNQRIERTPRAEVIETNTPKIFAIKLDGLHHQLGDRMASQLTTKRTLNLAVAKEIATAAEAEAREHGWNVSIAIVDEAGRLLYFQRMDDTTNASVEVAIAKASHAANYCRDTKFHEDILSAGNNVVLGLPNSLPIEGGLRLIYEGKVIGGIGVSGAQSEQDGQIAQAGAGLLASATAN